VLGGVALKIRVLESPDFCHISDHFEKHNFIKNGNLDPATHIQAIE
jgi:hypothetical protein